MTYSTHLQESIDGCSYGDNHPNVVKTREFVRLVTSTLMADRMNATAPNRAIRACAARLEEELTDPEVRAICRRIRNEPFPRGYVSRLSRLLEHTDYVVGKALDAKKRIDKVTNNANR
ncbi:hypothetical protein ACNJKD_01865 [Edwardsiella tarda]|uniref:DUF7740 domain-containing protein n=1 Tax=Edwardsiella tarda TaxID=636 RepID=UPI003A8667A4